MFPDEDFVCVSRQYISGADAFTLNSNVPPVWKVH